MSPGGSRFGTPNGLCKAKKITGAVASPLTFCHGKKHEKLVECKDHMMIGVLELLLAPTGVKMLSRWPENATGKGGRPSSNNTVVTVEVVD